MRKIGPAARLPPARAGRRAAPRAPGGRVAGAPRRRQPEGHGGAAARGAREARLSTPEPRPLMVFDGECGFCRAWIARWQRVTGARVAYEPFQTAAARHPEVPLEDFRAAVHLLGADG